MAPRTALRCHSIQTGVTPVVGVKMALRAAAVTLGRLAVTRPFGMVPSPVSGRWERERVRMLAVLMAS